MFVIYAGAVVFAGYWLWQLAMLFILQHPAHLWSVARKKRLEQAECVALVVIAHPDDESMFFAPSIRALKTAGWRVKLLCLSTGDWRGEGAVRCKELEQSAKVLECDEVIIENALCDDPGQPWPGATILAQVTPHCQGVDWLITFDLHGVSGHLNHTSISEALLAAHSLNLTLPDHVLTLESVPTVLKYWGPMALVLEASMMLADLMIPPTDQRLVAFLPWSDVKKRAMAAMQQHASQMKWFRWLYIYTSRYMHLNTLILHQRKK